MYTRPTHTHTHANTCIYTQRDTATHTHTHVRVRTHTHMYTHTQGTIDITIDTNRRVHIDIYMYIYILMFSHIHVRAHIEIGMHMWYVSLSVRLCMFGNDVCKYKYMHTRHPHNKPNRIYGVETCLVVPKRLALQWLSTYQHPPQHTDQQNHNITE